MKYTYLCLLLLTLAGLKAQSGKIIGSIVDSKTGETLPGATVLLEGTTKGAATDFDGNFSIIRIEPGTYNLIIQYVSYNTTKLQGIQVTADKPTVINVTLEPSSSQELQEVQVTVTLDKQNNAALILQQKNAASVSDGISAETIKKTPDRSTSDVLKRVSGASIQDNRFAIIRGLSDRYNSAFINGAPLPSSESDRRAFSFDIFPANMLDNMVITKTATPDLPAEFAGGVINISTRSVPEKNFQFISAGTSLHTLTTFKTFRTYEGGKLDWLGIDDGTRAIPKGIPSTKDFGFTTADQKAELAKLVTPSWGITSKSALPGGNFHYSMGRNFESGVRRFGFIFGYTYLNNPVRNQNLRAEFEESSSGVIKRTEFKDEVFTENVMSSALLNMAFKLNDNNQLSFKNMYSINSSDRVTLREGARDIFIEQYERSSNRIFTTNRLYTGQLEGNHLFTKSKLKLKWTGGYGDINRAIPNSRRVVYQRSGEEEGDTPAEYVAVVQNNGTIPTAAGNMFWSDTKEKIYTLNYQLAMPVDFKSIKNEIKIGGMQQLRNRDFVARNLGFSRYRKSSQPSAPFESELLSLPEDSIFAPEHLGLQQNGKGGFKLEEATKVHDSYRAQSMLNAGYLMTDSRLTDKFRVIVGARFESYQQIFSYTELGTNLDRVMDTTINDILPSLNLVYSLSQKSNLRAAYYRTVSRPEFRELAPFQFYNFEQDNIISGDPNLQRALIDNADLRYEIFPGGGQLFSVSGFYKRFNNPIELYMRAGTSGAPELSYTNVPSATNYGLELEYRFTLDKLTKRDSSLFFSNATLFTNVAVIRSKVDVSQIRGAEARPLQGQSPFIINGGFYFAHPTKEWTASVSYNLVGRRIFIVGNVQEPDVWERGRHVVDLQVSKTLWKNLQIAVNIKDIIAQSQVFYQNLNASTVYEGDVDNYWQETTYGRTLSFTASYRF